MNVKNRNFQKTDTHKHLKQVKLIYKGGVSKKEKEEYATAIRRNCIESMQTILEVRREEEASPSMEPHVLDVDV